IKENVDAGQAVMKTVPGKDYILLPFWAQDPPISFNSKDSPDARFKPLGEEKKRMKVNSPVNDAGIENDVVNENIISGCADDPNIPFLEGIYYSNDDEYVGVEADMTNLDTHIPFSPIPTTKLNKDHPLSQIIKDIMTPPQTRRMTRNKTGHEPKKVTQALIDPSWIEVIQEEVLQFKLQKVWTLVDLPYDKRAIRKKWVFKNKKDERGTNISQKDKNKAKTDKTEHVIRRA
ncbi:hypothetical protein Tco_0742768, partial [Tanacetum coccineum]